MNKMPLPDSEAVLVASIVCSQCDTALDPAADVCPSCGAAVSGARASSPGSRQRILDRPWLIIVLMLHLGVLGIPLYWKTSYSLKTRWLLVFLSIVYTAFAVAVIVWSFGQIAKAVQLLSS
jgi:hypothetical protein